MSNTELNRARGRMKNARNQLRGMVDRLKKDEDISEESVEYTLDEVLAALEHVENVMEES